MSDIDWDKGNSVIPNRITQVLAITCGPTRQFGLQIVFSFDVNLKFYSLVPLCLAATVLFGGCRRQAYTELYVEHMASEIRELEDRIYEYDAEYRALESELVYAEERNRRLQDLLNDRTHSPTTDPIWQSESSFSSPSSELPSVLIEPGENSSNRLDDAPSSGKGNRRENQRRGSSSDHDSSSSSDSRNSLPPPIEGGGISPMPDANADSPGGIGFPDSLRIPGENSGRPSNLPESNLRDRETRQNLTNPRVRVSSRPTRSIEPDELQPPSIDIGPSLLDSSDSNRITPPKLSTTVADGDLLDSKIDLPSDLSVQLASATERVATQEERDARLLSTVKPVEQDRKVVEIGYHPVLCRGWNMDEINGDDGVSIVLQPRNAAGECIDVVGELTVVLVDPNQSGDAAKVGFHTVDAEKVRESTESFGSAKGIHLTLPWQYGIPTGNELLIAVKFVTEDGRQMKNTKTIPISLDGSRSAAWTPRTTR